MSLKGRIEDYACPLCGRTVREHLNKTCIFLHSNDVGQIICGHCFTKIMMMKQKERSGNLEEFRRRIEDFDRGKGKQDKRGEVLP